MTEPKKQNYLHGAAILATGVVIMKILGAIYKIPLTNILGDAGYGYFNAAYLIYNVLLSISTAGLPVALSRIISEENALGRGNQAKRTFNVAITSLALIGAVFSAIMMLFPTELAIILVSTPESSQSILALSPAVFLVCICSAFRGYIQGHSDMKPTTISQVLEVLIKVIIGLSLAVIVVNLGKSIPIASAAAMFGVTAGAFFAMIYLYSQYKKYKMAKAREVYTDTPDSYWATFSYFFKIAIPITLGASVMSVISLLDTKLVKTQLLMNMAADVTDVLYGSYSAMLTLFNLPAAFITPLAISVVPAISAAVVAKRHSEASEVAESSMRIASVLAMPMAIGLAVLSYPIVNVLYSGTHEIGPTLLVLLGIASFFVCMSLLSNAILQANGNEKFTVVSMLVGGCVKLCVNWVLVGNPDINIVGAPIGTIACYFVMCLLNFGYLKKKLVKAPNYANVFVRPLVSSLVMGAGAWATYGLVSNFLGGADISRMMMALAMFVAIIVAVIIYLILVIATRAITAADMKLIPKGEKLAKLLKIK